MVFRSVKKRKKEEEEEEEEDVRLVLALGASEPCYGAEDDDEDDADEETPAVFGAHVSDALILGMRRRSDVPVCHLEEL